ncbi:MAG: hypothetical protein ACYTFG_11135 [Planctomycetota bacterium]|jgi:hypothetical protein
MTPDSVRFSEREKAVIRTVRTPYQVQQFLNALPYNSERMGETLRTFRGVLKHNRAHCLEAALTAAVILEQHGIPPLLMDLESQDDLDHVLLLYRKDGKWGTVARSRDPGLHGRKPVFKSVKELVDSYADPYIDHSGRIIGFGVLDLNDLGRYDWRLSLGNVWKVQQALIDMDHRPFHMAENRYRFWHERFEAYKRRFPHRKPLYFGNKASWTAGYPRGPWGP